MSYQSNRAQYQAKLKQATDAALMSTAAYYVERVRASFTLRGRGISSPPGTPPSVQSGDLRRRMYSRLKGPGVAAAGSNLRYARIQELGGVIKEKAKKLAVPLGERGRRLAKIAGGSIANLDLVAVPIRGKVFLFEEAPTKKNKGKNPPVFVLKERVVLPPRPYLVPMLRRAKDDMRRVFAERMRELTR